MGFVEDSILHHSLDKEYPYIVNRNIKRDRIKEFQSIFPPHLWRYRSILRNFFSLPTAFPLMLFLFVVKRKDPTYMFILRKICDYANFSN